MQALYVIGFGENNFEELRYSLRSLEKHCPFITEVCIIGERVPFLAPKDVNFMYLPEFIGNKEYRIAMKIYTACERGLVSDDFMFMNDDFFFLKDYDPTLNYYDGPLGQSSIYYYNEALTNTRNYLNSNKMSIHNFDVHTPIVYNSSKFISLEKVWNDVKEAESGMVIKSLYGNIFNLRKTARKDVKLTALNNQPHFDRIKDVSVFSCSEIAWNRGVGHYLKAIYPNKSKYEID